MIALLLLAACKDGGTDPTTDDSEVEADADTDSDSDSDSDSDADSDSDTDPADPEDCATVGDEDLDGKADCADEDCDGGCPEDCADFRDNDGDARVDCSDEDCAASCTEDCAAVGDEDRDGLDNCDDPDCAELCMEDCDDAVDQDGDGLVDCDDPECAADPVCGNKEYSIEVDVTLDYAFIIAGPAVTSYFGVPAVATGYGTVFVSGETTDSADSGAFNCSGQFYLSYYSGSGYGSMTYETGSCDGCDWRMAADFNVTWDSSCMMLDVPVQHVGFTKKSSAIKRLDEAGAWTEQWTGSGYWGSQPGYQYGYLYYLSSAGPWTVTGWY